MDFKGTSTPMGPNGFYFDLIYNVDMSYECWMDSRFTFVYKGVLVIMHGCIRDSKKGLKIGLIN